jgi:hypothetical protein
MGKPSISLFPSDASLPGCVRNWMRPVISSPSDASLPGCVRNWMRPSLSPLPAMRRCPDASGTGCVQLSPLPAMRRCPDASGTGCVQLSPLPAMRRCPDASGTGCVQFISSPSDASLPGRVRNWMRPVIPPSQRCVATRMRPETGCVQFAVMRRCPDASGNWMRSVNGDASLPGMRPELDASSQRRCVAARMRPKTGCVQFAAMRRWPDASEPGCIQLTSSLRDASLPGCVQQLDQRRVAAPDASDSWMRLVNLPTMRRGTERPWTGYAQRKGPQDSRYRWSECARSMDLVVMYFPAGCVLRLLNECIEIAFPDITGVGCQPRATARGETPKRWPS